MMNVASKRIGIAALSVLLSACASMSPQRYSPVPDHAPILRALPVKDVRIDPFTMSAQFDAMCRQASMIDPPVNQTFPQYLQVALADELKVAGLHAERTPSVTISGDVTQLSFSSSKGLVQGEWQITLKLTSSNGKQMTVSELYEFASGFEGVSACRRTADAFLPAVQNLVRKVIESRDFLGLVQS